MAIQFDLVRPDDLLNLRVQGINLRLNSQDPDNPALVVENPAKGAFLILIFPPQTIHERAYYEAQIVKIPQDPETGVPPDPDAAKSSIDPPLDPPGYVDKERPTAAQIGHPSRLVFKVPADRTIPYTIAGLLDWSALELSVNPIAAIGPDPTKEEIANAPAIQAPKLTETALELPYRLVISPTAAVTWAHRAAPLTHEGQTELWHTRLQLRGAGGTPQELSPTATAPLRAIWSDDFNPLFPPNPNDLDPDLQRTAMAPNDRHQLVILTSAFHGYVVDRNVSYTFNFHQPWNMPPVPAFELLQQAGGDQPLSIIDDVLQPDDAGEQPIALEPMANAPISMANLPLFNMAPTEPARENVVAMPYGRVQRKETMPYVPEPFDASQLMLSPLGGWLKSRGHWDPPRTAPPLTLASPAVEKAEKAPYAILAGLLQSMGDVALAKDPATAAKSPISDSSERANMEFGLLIKRPKEQLDLSEWIHVATQGRDHYVRIVYEGELLPFHNRAALVKVTERKFKETGNIVGAYMIQRMFIVVREPVKTFNERGLPFRKIRLTTLVTPDIALPSIISGTKRSFWVEVMTGQASRAPFQFHAVGTDRAGDEIDFTIPMMFFSLSDNPGNNAKVAAAYNAKDMIEKRQALVPGQKMTFADRHSDPDKATDNTRLATEALNFVVDAAMNPPRMLKATVKVPQVNELLGTDNAVDIRYFENYVKSGFDTANGVFAEFARLNSAGYDAGNPFGGVEEDTLKAIFNAQQAGGIATPNMALSTLTRELGPVAGKAVDALKDMFDPADFFGDIPALLFGTFGLDKLIPIGGTLGHNAPKMTTRTSDIPGGKKIVTRIDWQPALKDLDLTVAEFRKDYLATSEFKILGLIEKEIKLNNVLSEPIFDMSGRLTNFQVLILGGVVTVNFTEFSFKSRSGQKTDVTVKLDPAKPIAFGGDLEFVEELRKAIPPNLFGKGASLDISPTGIRAGFAFALPPIAVGVFSLKDVALGAALTLPFLDGKPVLDFNVSERQQPFLLAVGIFGGGGFFRLQLDTAGMKMVEASFEFGATAALDIGVASGEVHIMAGIYFSLARKEGATETTAVLTGFLRMGGSLNVLGLVKLSVEFNLSFTYDSDTEKAYGRATLTVHVEVLMFSASVELTVERAFGGKSGDPKFMEMYDTAERWSEYALAFA